jgi:hypothetical protein
VNQHLPREVAEKLSGVLEDWRQTGLPTRDQLLEQAESFQHWREGRPQTNRQADAPHLVTATLDDGTGHGLGVIQAWSRAVGLTVHHVGLLQPSAAILAACRRLHPAYLGLTVLQFDSEEDLAVIGQGLPQGTKLIVGGPIFRADPDLAARTGVHYVARDVAAYLGFLLADGGH